MGSKSSSKSKSSSQDIVAVEESEYITKLHNDARAKCGSKGNLQWDEGLAEYAKGYATKMAEKKKLSHTLDNHNSYADKNAGENLAMSGGSPVPTLKEAALTAVNGWAEEGKKGPPEAPNHYTAMMWDDVEKIGCGQTKNGNTVYTACNYGGGSIPNMNYGTGKSVPCSSPITVEGYARRVSLPDSESYTQWRS